MTGNKLLIPVCLILGLSACAGNNSKHSAETMAFSEKMIQANGYSRFNDSSQLNVGHRWLSAQQAAKTNAYRALAEQLYYEPLGKHTTVGLQVMRHEVYRTYLDIYLRNARASDYRTTKDRLKTTLALKLTPRFYQCMAGDVAQTQHCINEDGKLAVTRLGYKSATVRSMNMACATSDCSDQFHVKGFSRRQGAINDTLLDNGFYDLEWTVNSGLRILFNYLLTYGFTEVL